MRLGSTILPMLIFFLSACGHLGGVYVEFTPFERVYSEPEDYLDREIKISGFVYFFAHDITALQKQDSDDGYGKCLAVVLPERSIRDKVTSYKDSVVIIGRLVYVGDVSETAGSKTGVDSFLVAKRVQGTDIPVDNHCLTDRQYVLVARHIEPN